MLVKFKYRVYYDEQSGYSVCQYRNVDSGKKVTCVGTHLPIVKEITYEFITEEYYTAKYGQSYKVLTWSESVNKTKEDIIAYLASGLFTGISQKIANHIFECFGEDTLMILDHDIDRLLEVPGIGHKTLKKIKTSYIEKRASREIAEKLMKYGFPATNINRIYETYKAEALQIIDEAPYELCKVRGISFPMADRVAKDKHIPLSSYARIKAASDYVLTEDMLSGNVCMSKMDYALKLIKVLNTPDIHKGNVLDYVLQMIKDQAIKYNKRISSEGKKEYFYLPIAYKVEREIATKVKQLLVAPKRNVPNIDELIDKYAGTITLDEIQKEAVKMGVCEPVYVITGGPGTGKTTILRIIALINEELNCRNNNVFLSPTGRAARRITESTGYSAKTVHSALGLQVSEVGCKNEDYYIESPQLEGNNVIVDEASMLDMWTMHGILMNLKNSSLGLIGDVNQLPSVQCGSVLRDLICSGEIPCIELEHIHRQANDAKNICENAKHIKDGEHILQRGDDFRIVYASNLTDAEDKLVLNTLEQIHIYGLEHVKVLCPFKKGECGVYHVNTILQEKLNPLVLGRELKIPNDMVLRIGDPVMQLKNIDEVANGDIGYVIDITETDIIVDFMGNIIEYTHIDAKEQLILAYATTIHKSQGSEYDSVILCMTTKHGLMKKRNVLYTGITRGKHKVTLIGTYEAFYEAIDNNMIEDRHSMLAELLKEPAVPHISTIISIPKHIEYQQMSLPF